MTQNEQLSKRQIEAADRKRLQILEKEEVERNKYGRKSEEIRAKKMAEYERIETKLICLKELNTAEATMLIERRNELLNYIK